MLMGGIGTNYGGVTSVVLNRSSMFADVHTKPVAVLTVSYIHGIDPEERRREAIDDERLDPRVELRNAWFEARTLPDSELARFTSTQDIDSRHAECRSTYSGNARIRRYSDTGVVLQTDWFRDDGTLAISDRRDVDVFGSVGSRLLTLFDRSQKPIGQWRGTGEFYKSWLEYVANNNPCIFICDSENIRSLLKTGAIKT